MKVKMLKTQRGSVDGIHVQAYTAGTEYELSGNLLKVFLDNKWASEVVEAKAQSVPENKMEYAPVENKKEKRDKK